MKTKILSITLALLLCVSLAPSVFAAAETVYEGDDYKITRTEIPGDYDRVDPFSDGLAEVIQDDKYGFIDRTGKVVIPLEYEDAYDFKEGFAPVKKGGKWGYIDKANKTVVPFEYDSAATFSNGFAWVQKGDKRGYIGKSGGSLALVIPLDYDAIGNFSTENIAPVKKGAKWGYIDTQGKLVIPYTYDSAGNFSEGLAWAIKNDEIGFIDVNSNIAIPFGWGLGVCSFSEGIAGLESGEDSVWELIDRTGKDVLYGSIYRQNAPYSNSGPYPWFNDGVLCMTQFSASAGAPRWHVFEKIAVASTPTTQAAKPTSSTILVNGKSVAFDAYIINGNNYFKLRDVAYTLSGTEKQFDVGYSDTTKAIALTSGKAYTVVGGEMMGKGSETKTANPTSSKIFSDGKETPFTAYTIGGNNYFKLRDVAAAFDFAVEWDGANNTIAIDTSRGYTPD
jgi:hypothetical protein